MKPNVLHVELASPFLSVYDIIYTRALKRSFVDARAQYCDIRREREISGSPSEPERLITRAHSEARGFPSTSFSLHPLSSYDPVPYFIRFQEVIVRH